MQAYTIQTGTFHNPENANMLIRELRDKGYSVYTIDSQAQGKSAVKVRVGTFTDPVEAERIAATMRNQGYTAEVVKK